MTSCNSGKPCQLGTRRTAWASHKNTAMPNEALSVMSPAIRVEIFEALYSDLHPHGCGFEDNAEEPLYQYRMPLFWTTFCC